MNLRYNEMYNIQHQQHINKKYNQSYGSNRNKHIKKGKEKEPYKFASNNLKIP